MSAAVSLLSFLREINLVPAFATGGSQRRAGGSVLRLWRALFVACFCMCCALNAYVCFSAVNTYVFVSVVSAYVCFSVVRACVCFSDVSVSVHVWFSFCSACSASSTQWGFPKLVI